MIGRRGFLGVWPALLAACALAEAPPACAVDPKLKVVASFSIVANMVEEIGGDSVEVVSLIGPDADAHVFEPTPADVRRLAQARLVVVNGLGFEGWIDRLIAVSGYRGEVVVASRGIEPLAVNGGPDPHAWQSLPNSLRYVENIRVALAEVAPAKAEEFDRRASLYSARIAALDRSIRQRLARLPPGGKTVITAHEAFGYFGAEYGIRFIAARRKSAESEPTAGAIAQIVRQIRSEGAGAIFPENIGDPRMVERIASEAGIRIGGRLYSDALSRPGTEADSYLKMMEHNAAALIEALER